jgi:hypothetical protein
VSYKWEYGREEWVSSYNNENCVATVEHHQRRLVILEVCTANNLVLGGRSLL